MTSLSYGLYQINQSEPEFLCSGCSCAESKQTGLEQRHVGNRGRGKETAGHRQSAKKRSEALPQMRHSCKSDSETLAETLPSFLGWRKHCSLTFFLLSLRLLSPQALQNPGIKKKHPPNPPPPFLPPSLAYKEQTEVWRFLFRGWS